MSLQARLEQVGGYVLRLFRWEKVGFWTTFANEQIERAILAWQEIQMSLRLWFLGFFRGLLLLHRELQRASLGVWVFNVIDHLAVSVTGQIIIPLEAVGNFRESQWFTNFTFSIINSISGLQTQRASSCLLRIWLIEVLAFTVSFKSKGANPPTTVLSMFFSDFAHDGIIWVGFSHWLCIIDKLSTYLEEHQTSISLTSHLQHF